MDGAVERLTAPHPDPTQRQGVISRTRADFWRAGLLELPFPAVRHIHDASYLWPRSPGPGPFLWPSRPDLKW